MKLIRLLGKVLKVVAASLIVVFFVFRRSLKGSKDPEGGAQRIAVSQSNRAPLLLAASLLAIGVMASFYGIQHERSIGAPPRADTADSLVATNFVVDRPGVSAAVDLVPGADDGSQSRLGVAVGVDVPKGGRVQWALSLAFGFQPTPESLDYKSNAVSTGVSVSLNRVIDNSPNRVGSVYELRGTVIGPSTGFTDLTAISGTSRILSTSQVSYTQMTVPGLSVAQYSRSFVTIPLVAAKDGITSEDDPAALDFPDPGPAVKIFLSTLQENLNVSIITPSGQDDGVLPAWSRIMKPSKLQERERFVVRPLGYAPSGGGQQPDAALSVWTWTLGADTPAGGFSNGQSESLLASENDGLFRSSLAFGLAGTCAVALLQTALELRRRKRGRKKESTLASLCL